ncbi:Ada metal-binding domain-containing protein [Larkinella terrae]|uniref:Metal-binding protein n=1 Tax=Larkinella terrae TaxID=2025311 RepID=A0A7K0ETE0_9BACT|nr:Ada metal-binding domain-containing protein [Larkinella terrae]MRS65085.1 metal-binding protein [Larkinella terrae]
MIRHTDFDDSFSGKVKLRQLIQTKEITLGGNLTLKIYGTLACKSGKRMLRKNRAFFQSENDAIQSGFRPCGHCLPEKYRQWKSSGNIT